MGKNKWIKRLGTVLMLASIVFIVYALYSMDVDYSALLSWGMVGYLLLGALIYSVTLFISTKAWQRVLQFLSGMAVPYKDVCPVYTKANIGKYMPGNFMHYANRNIFGSALGLGQLDMAISSVLEIALTVLTAMFWALLFAAKDFIGLVMEYLGGLGIPLLVAIGIFGVAVVVVALVVLYRKKPQYFEKFKQMLSLKFAGLCGGNVLLYSVVLFIPGLIFVWLVSWNSPVQFTDVITLVAAYIISWVIGFVVPGAPGGIGVREALLLVLTQGIVSEQAILVAVVMQRLVSVLGDIIAFGLGSLVKKGANKNAPQRAPHQ